MSHYDHKLRKFGCLDWLVANAGMTLAVFFGPCIIAIVLLCLNACGVLHW